MASEDIRGISPLLRVDGGRIDPAAVAIHWQRDPFPGGHRWFLSLIGPGAERVLGSALAAGGRPLDGEASDRLLSELQVHLPRLAFGARDVPTRFMLNTVDHLDVATGHLELGGVCSPIGPRPSG